MNRFISLLLLGGLAAFSRADVTIYTLNGAYNVNPGNPVISAWSSIANFQSATSPTNTTRNQSQGTSADISISANGTVYFMANSDPGAGSRTIYSWSSLANWASNTGAVLQADRTSNNSEVKGMSFYNNELYVLQGSRQTSGAVDLRKWATFADFQSGSAGTSVATRSLVGAGFGFEIGADGSVWTLQQSDNTVTTAASGTLYRWASIADFQNDTNSTSYAYSTGGPYAGLAVAVPEPGTMLLGGIAACAGGAGAWWKRRKRKAAEQPATV